MMAVISGDPDSLNAAIVRVKTFRAGEPCFDRQYTF